MPITRMEMISKAMLEHYRVVQTVDEDGYCHAFIPTLGRSLFHGVGKTPAEALECLDEIAPKLLRWSIENGVPLKPPQNDDRPIAVKKTEARKLSLRASVYYAEC